MSQLWISSITVKPQATLLCNHLKVSSARWQQKQFVSAIKHGARPAFRITEAQQQRMVTVFLDDSLDLLCNPSRWLSLPEECLTQSSSSLAFAMTARALGGVTQMLSHRHWSHPYRLFGLLGPEAATYAHMIESDPACMLDPLAKDILAKYRGKLLSEERFVCLSHCCCS